MMPQGKTQSTNIHIHTAEYVEYMIGVDEAGRGALAGPVVAAAVALPQKHAIQGIQDSKRLTPERRQRVYDAITSSLDTSSADISGSAALNVHRGIFWGVGIVDVETIEAVNILQATVLAMEKALDALFERGAQQAQRGGQNGKFCAGEDSIRLLRQAPICIDGNYFHSKRYPSFQTIVGGDAVVEAIAAASIVAKVTRDAWMTDVADKHYPAYKFARHKGYGTLLHRTLLRRHGVCPLHRSLFVRKVLRADIL